MIEIGRCREKDVGALTAFIDRYWSPGHALASRTLMDWQHREPDGGYAYLLARRDDEIAGVLGYIPTRRFDPALAVDNVLWLALWKVREELGVPGLGLRLLSTLGKLEPAVAVAVNGINPAHPPMYRGLGWDVGELQQFVTIAPGRKSRLISGRGDRSLPTPIPGPVRFTELNAEDLRRMNREEFDTALPMKTPAYFAARFFAHPVYRYRVYLAEGRGGERALIATRLATHEDACALRIVDFLGNPALLADAGAAIGRLLEESDAEYADFHQTGIPAATLAAAGFAAIDPEGPIVVPNYFEPFSARNVRIHYAIRRRTGRPTIICRADGDQDRPNIAKTVHA